MIFLLPEDIGDFPSLEKIYVLGCLRLSEVPHSVMNCGLLKHVMLSVMMKIEISKTDIRLKWLPKVGPKF